MSQRRQSHLSCQVGQSHLGTSWYAATMSQIGRFYLRTSETSR